MPGARLIADRLRSENAIAVLNDVVLNQVVVRFGADETAERGDELTRAAIARIQLDGAVFAGGAKWRGREVMRISVISWLTDEAAGVAAADAIVASWRAVQGAPSPWFCCNVRADHFRLSGALFELRPSNLQEPVLNASAGTRSASSTTTGILHLTDVIHQKRAVQHSKGKRAMLIVNPRARRGGGSIDAARQVLVDAGLEIEEMATSKDENASELISRHADHFDIAIVGGGDGTLNNAAAGLAHTGLTLGVLPLGTANDFARTMGIAPDPVKAAEIIAAGHQTTVDLGEVNGHLFFNVASIGFSAELAGELTEHAKKRWGTLGYGIVAARLLMRSRLFTAYVDHDDTTEEIHTMQVSVGNGRHYGGGMTVEETATADDGWLDFYSLEVDHWWRLLRLLPSLRKGTQGQWDDVRAFKTTEVTIRTKRPRPVNTDGELVTWTPAHFRIRPKSVRVFAPRT